MASSINTNISSIRAQNSLARSGDNMQTAAARLASGTRINSAKDDASGLAISERMKAKSSGMQVAMRNAADGISYAQTAESAYKEMGEIYLHLRNLTVQAKNGSNNEKDLINLDKAYESGFLEVAKINNSTEFNGQRVFSNFSYTETTRSFHIGHTSGSENTVEVSTESTDTAYSDLIRLASGFGDSTFFNHNFRSNQAFAFIENALEVIATERAHLGATINRFESVISRLGSASAIAEESRSRITDTDFAIESAKLSRNQILQQASTAMLVQANQTPFRVLSLLS